MCLLATQISFWCSIYLNNFFYFVIIESYIFFIYSGHKSFIKYVNCKYFLQIFRLLLVVSFREQVFNLVKSDLSVLMDCAFGITSKKCLHNLKSQFFFLKIVLDFTFNYMINLDFFIAHGLRDGLKFFFFFLYMVIQFFQNHLLERHLFSNELLLKLCWKYNS